jgi:S-adenosylmethionine decarboxylase
MGLDIEKQTSSLPIGKHVYVNLYDIEPRLLENEGLLVSTVVQALKDEGLEPLDVKSWSFGGKKGGVSVIVLLEGAHLVIHTWVEYRYATLDILVTGDIDPRRIFEKVAATLRPKSYKVGYAYRGLANLTSSPP